MAYKVSALFERSLGIARSLTRSRRRRGLVFHHIPKCAGSSITAALRKQYAPWENRHVPSEASVHTGAFFFDEARFHRDLRLSSDDPRWKAIHAHRVRMLHTFIDSGAKAASGHVLYHPGVQEQYAETHYFITILRDPVDRFVSQYFFNKKDSPYVTSPGDVTEEELAKEGEAWGSALAFFLGGGRSLFTAADDETSTATLVAEAKTAVERLSVVGFVDRMDMFQRALAEVVGIDLRIGRRNTAKPRSAESAEMQRVRELAQTYCAPDREVYEHARKVWGGRTC